MNDYLDKYTVNVDYDEAERITRKVLMGALLDVTEYDDDPAVADALQTVIDYFRVPVEIEQ